VYVPALVILAKLTRKSAVTVPADADVVPIAAVASFSTVSVTIPKIVVEDVPLS